MSVKRKVTVPPGNDVVRGPPGHARTPSDMARQRRRSTSSALTGDSCRRPSPRRGAAVRLGVMSDSGSYVAAQLAVRRGPEAVRFYVAASGAREMYQVGGDEANPSVVSQLEVGATTFWVADEAPDHGSHSP